MFSSLQYAPMPIARLVVTPNAGSRNPACVSRLLMPGLGWTVGEDFMASDSSLAQWLGTYVGPYRLEQVLDQGMLGPAFRGRERTSGAEVRIRLLNVPPARSDEAADAYRRIVEREAPQIATLRPPYILPLTDYGVQHGVVYL